MTELEGHADQRIIISLMHDGQLIHCLALSHFSLLNDLGYQSM